MTVHDVIQRSPEWVAVRLGRVCGSRAADMLAMDIPPEFTPTGRRSTAKAKELAGRRNLRAQLVLERLTGKSHERSFQSQAMLDGVEREAEALSLYELTSDRPVYKVGYVAHDDLLAGVSPDGRLGDFEGLVEAKCPMPATHLEYLKTGKVPDEYYKQCLHATWVTGAQYCDWVSFHPEFPEYLRLRIVRLTFTPEQLIEYEGKVRTFLDEVQRELDALATLTDLRGTLEAAVAVA